jgi:transcriptional regulator with XRE-family HTH domain
MSSNRIQLRAPIALRADRLRALRESHGWSQREFARRCGFSSTIVQNYEGGEADPSATNLKVMAEKLGVSTDYLVDLTDEPHHRSDESLHGDERRLVEAYIVRDYATILELVTNRMREGE